MENSNATRKLPVKLTRDEYDAKAQELSARLTTLEEMEASLKSVTKSMKDSIEGIKAEVKILTKIVRTRIEDRDVECVEIRDEDRMVMHVIRCDTRDIAETRPMSAAERQLVMFPTSRLRVVGDNVVDTPDVTDDGKTVISEQQEDPAAEKVSGDTTTMPPEEAEPHE